ncbi:MAG: imidazoleglycerol-phosphate dehydratase HisB [Candidatus Coatesbacteria bacterium]
MANRRRVGTVKRDTRETRIALKLGLDERKPRTTVATTIPFFDHMLTLLAAHGGLALTLKASGDTEVDDHHLVEDVGICLGQALTKALGDKAGIRRYGDATVPMDEALVQAVLDLSGRAHLSYGLNPSAKKVKTFDVALVREFFEGLTREGRLTLHLRQLSRGGNAHHEIEAAFKAVGRALGEAVGLRPGVRDIMSTKGRL